MKKGIVGKKIGMTQIFTEDGRLIPVTVIQAGPCPVVQKKTAEKDGYEAIQVGFDAYAPNRAEKLVNKPLKGHFKKAEVAPTRNLRELRLEDCSQYNVGDEIKVDVFAAGDRVDITEQADNETDPALVTGGWLVEIDNYNEDTQVRIKESNGEMLRFTYHSPEVLSEVQRQYLTQLMTTADHAIYNPDKTDTAWEQLIDMDVLARYYIVQELMDDAESFHGSCFIYKDRGDDTRLMFGPVWDFGNTFRRSLHHFIYDNPPYGQNWIGEIAKFPRFQQRVRELWQHYLAHGEPVMHDFIDDFISQIAAAAITDAQRWPQYSQADTAQRATEFKRRLNEKTSFLKSQWGDLDVGITTIATGNEAFDTDNNWYLPDGRRLQAKPEKKGMYIHHGKLVVVGR